MALKLLLADDSLTAQNMGKKILVDAGYDVVAVSNGAAAVKKIAEVRPDLIILDVYMPGYNGLEVCERVKNAQETSSTPVLLTVGKMEPFKAEDGNRVRADGVVVKPFEATDLLAAVEKLAALLAPAAPSESPEYERTIKMTVPLEEDASYAEWQSSAAPHEEEAPAEKLTVPDEMAASPAISMDLLEPMPAVEPQRSTTALQPEELAAVAATPAPFAPFEPLPPEAAPLEMAPAEAAPLEVSPIELAPAEATAPAPQPELEVFEPTEEVVAPPPAELEFTGVAAVGEVEPARPEGFETTGAEATPAEALPPTDSLLVTDATEMASAFPTRFGIEGAEAVPVGVASEMEGLYADEQPPAEAPVLEEPSLEEPVLEEAAPSEPVHPPTQEIEALAPESTEEPPAAWAAHEEPAGAHEAAASLEDEMAAAMAAVSQPAPAEAAPPPAPSPEVLADEMQRAFADLPVEPAPPEEPLPPATAEQELESAMAAAAGASVTTSLASAVRTGTQKLDSAQIAQIAEIVQRVTDRFKYEIMNEIARELENIKR